MIDNLFQLARFEDRLSFLYVERGRIEQDAQAVAFVTETQRVPIPAADLAVLLLGPGTTITHRAMCNLAECNCTVIWCGENGVRVYAHGRGGTHFSANLLRQAALALNPRTRRQVVLRMYAKRFGQPLDPATQIRTVRAKEGYRVRQAYQSYAARFGIPWKGRRFAPDDWSSGDPVNRALSTASACLNGLVHAAIISGGYSPAIGFIHTGKMLSFVYDIADLYKVEQIVPLAFQTAAESAHDVESRVRLACRDHFRQVRLMQRILPEIREVLDGAHDPGTSPPASAGGSESLDDRTQGRDLPWSHDSPSPG